MINRTFVIRSVLVLMLTAGAYLIFHSRSLHQLGRSEENKILHLKESETQPPLISPTNSIAAVTAVDDTSGGNTSIKPEDTESRRHEASTHLTRRDDLLRGASFIASQSEPVSSAGIEKKVSLWKSTFKYPLLRVEETWKDGQLTSWLAAVADHVIVRTRDSLTPVQVRTLADQLGLHMRKDMYTENTYLLEIPHADLDDLPRTIARLQQHDALVIAEYDYVVYTMQTFPNDSSFSELWGLHNTGQDGGTDDVDIDAPEAWSITTGNPNVVVGVIDTGIQYDHPDLVQNMWFNPGETAGDNIDNDGNGFIDDIHGWDFVNDDSDPMDGNDHGTHCAGTIGGAGNNSIGVAGVNWAVKLMALKFLSDDGFGSTSDALDAVAYGTANDADLTSNSWGGGGYSDTLRLTIAEAYSNGIPFVAAAGNSSSDNDQIENYPSNYDVPNVIAVAAYDRNGNLASFSSYGATTVHIGAPGVNIYSTVSGGGYDSFSGTSMATPHVAGVVAQMFGVTPGLSPEQIRQFLIDTSAYMPALDGKTVANGSVNLFGALSVVSGAYILLDQYFFQDDGTNGTTGNADDIVNPNEIVGLWITTRNFGTETATVVNATLVSGDSAVTVDNPVISLGMILPQSTAVATNAFILNIGNVTTPYIVPLTLTIADNNGSAWTNTFSLTIFTSTTASGLVSSLSGPVADAVVGYTGPTSGAVTTAADGTYRVVLTDGSFDLNATKSGYLPDGPYSVNATGTVIHQNFYLTQPEIDVALNPIFLTLYQCETSSVTISITNLGDGNLTFEMAGLSDVWTAETGSLWHVSARRAYEGLDSWYYGQEDNGTYNTGSENRGSLISDLIMLPSSSLTFSFYSWKESENSGFWDLSLLDISTNRGQSWTTLLSTDDTVQEWESVSAALSNYAGIVANLRFRFDTIDSVNNNFEGWYVDAFRLNSQPLGWLTFDIPGGVIASGETETVHLNVRADLLTPGVFTNQIALLSNDGDEPFQSVPVTVTVVASPRYELAQWIISGDADNDGFPEPGETFDLHLVINNTGAANNTNGLALNLSSSDTNGSVLVSNSSAPAVITGGSTTNETAFQVSVSPSLPGSSTYPLPLTLELEDEEFCAIALEVILPVRDYASVCGTVLDECSGAPLAGIFISVMSTTGVAYATALSDATGEFCIDGIPALAVNLEFSGDHHTTTNRIVMLDYTSNMQVQVFMRNDSLISSPAALSVFMPPDSSSAQHVTLINSGSCAVSYCVAGVDGNSDLELKSGYRYTHSLVYNGPEYGWIDISTNGTAVNLFDDDNELIPIGFSFPFYGASHSNLYLCSNGWLSFTEPGTSYVGFPLPNLLAAENLIAFYWTDLDPSSGGSVTYHNIDEDTLVIQFTEVPYYGEIDTITLQVVLMSNGDILVNTLTVDDPPDPVVVGIQNSDATRGLTIANSGNFPNDTTTILIDPGTTYATIPSAQLCGTVPASSSLNLPIQFQNYGLPGNVYSETLELELNYGVRTLFIPISMVITGRFGHLVVTEPDAVTLSCTDAPPAICGFTVPTTWGLWATNGTTEAVRPAQGATFDINFDNGWINNGKTVGFNLRNQFNQELLTFFFVGGEGTYSILAAGGKANTGVPWTDNGLRIHIDTAGTNFNVRIIRIENSAVYQVAGTFAFGGTAADISNLRVFNYEAGPGSNYDVFFNHIRIDGRMDNASQVSYQNGWQTGDGMEGGLLPWISLANNGSFGGYFIGQNKNTGADSTHCSAYGWSTNGNLLAVNYVEVDQTAECGDYTRTWSIAQGGKTLSVVRAYALVDADPPEITVCPPDTTVTNISLVPVNTNSVAATDDCGTAIIHHQGDSSNGGAGTPGNPLVVTRVYAAVDACGNTALCTQIITAVAAETLEFKPDSVSTSSSGFQMVWSADTQTWQYVDAQNHEPVNSDYPWITIYTVTPPSPAVSTFTDTNDLPGRNYRLRTDYDTP